MKLVNTSSKVISIGETLLMPDKEISVSKSVADLPVIRAFASKGFIRIDEGNGGKKEANANNNVKSDTTGKAAKSDAAEKAKTDSAKSEKGTAKSDAKAKVATEK